MKKTKVQKEIKKNPKEDLELDKAVDKNPKEDIDWNKIRVESNIVTCPGVLEKCIDTAKEQNEAIKKQGKVIKEQDKLVKDLKKQNKSQKSTINQLTIGSVLSVLLLLL